MHVYSTLFTLAFGLEAVLSQPHNRHLHPKRDVNFNDPSLYSNINYNDIGVDWSKVNYGGNPSGKAAPVNPAPAPVVEQKNAVAAPVVDQAAPAVVSQPAATQSATPNTDTTTGGSTSASPGGSKRGLVYNWDTPSLAMFQSYAGSKVSWAWNWASDDFKIISGIQYIPCLQNLLGTSTGPWNANAQKAISAASSSNPAYLLGFNEPDIVAQANLSPAAAATAWGTYMTPLKGPNVKFGSPQVSNGVGTNSAGISYGLEWISQFMSACSGCQIDFIVVHWYGCTDGCSVDTDVAAFKDFVGKAVAAAGGKKIWITEFGTLNADQTSFIKATLPWLDGQAGVDRYAYFMVKEGALLSGTALSAAGQAYVA